MSLNQVKFYQASSLFPQQLFSVFSINCLPGILVWKSRLKEDSDHPSALNGFFLLQKNVVFTKAQRHCSGDVLEHTKRKLVGN